MDVFLFLVQTGPSICVASSAQGDIASLSGTRPPLLSPLLTCRLYSYYGVLFAPVINNSACPGVCVPTLPNNLATELVEPAGGCTAARQRT